MALSFNDLEDALKIDKHDLEEACLHHADFFYTVSLNTSEAISRRDFVRAQYENICASMQIALRKGKEKITISEVEASILLQPEVAHKQQELLDKKADVNRWEALKEAFEQRGYMLKLLVTLHMSSHYGDSSAIDGAAMRNNRLEHAATEVRRQHREGKR